MSFFKARGLAAVVIACAVLLSFLFVDAAFNDALALKPRGAWSPTLTYALDDIVTARGSTWRSRHANNRNKLPGSTSPSTAADWELFAAGFNPLGGWTNARRYEINDLVIRLGATWRARNTNLNKPPESNAANWIKLAARGLTGATGATGPQGPQGVPGSTAVANGSAAAPAFKFTSSTSTGMFSPSTGKIALAANGTLFLHDIGDDNTGLGLGALGFTTTGRQNTAVGANALLANTEGEFNTAVGLSALQENTTGDSNTAVGRLALNQNSTGSNNTAVGRDALLNNTASGNSAVGFEALRSNTTGTQNTALGTSALRANTESNNTAVGFSALGANTTGRQNTALGDSALLANTEGEFNTAVGRTALQDNTTGDSNTAVGAAALFDNTVGGANTAVGDSALASNEAGNNNTALGDQALLNNTNSDNTAVGAEALKANTGTGSENTAVGRLALTSNTNGGQNTATGTKALDANTTGDLNTAIGHDALGQHVSGDSNTGVGAFALSGDLTGSGNVGIGADAGLLPTASVNSIFIRNIGEPADTLTIKIGVNDTQTRTFIAGIEGRTTEVADAIPVLIASNGQLGTVSSSRRYKEDIRPMGAMSDMLAELRPVQFRYKKPYADGSKPIEYGLIAEEVAEIFPYLAVFNEGGRPETVKYHLLPTFLLAGYQEQQRIIAAQAERIAALEERLLRIEAALNRPSITAASDSR